MSKPEVTLDFVAGTIELRNVPEGHPVAEMARFDPRTACLRAPACRYADLVRTLHRSGLTVTDRARAYTTLSEGARVHRQARSYQSEALSAWQQAGGRGVVVLPTGAGKTHVAVMAIDNKRRSTLVVAPTLDLVRQWYDLLRTTFAMSIGIVGGGEHTVQPITVTTYDSAYLHMESIGNRFGLIVFDECHHLPGASYALAAELCLAPFRLGLSATPERADGREGILPALVGPIVYKKDIRELAGDYLAAFDTLRLVVELSPSERQQYEEARATYREFVRSSGIRMSSPQGWSEFIMLSARSEAGQQAMRAYRRQREIAFAAPVKLDYLEQLLFEHRKDRMIIFTDDNSTAYAIAHRFLIPPLTHQTKIKERSEILERFSSGAYNAVVTSKVLNEGVDVPEASVAVVMSGSGAVREHVQRLGRILRPIDGKRAVLYELVSADTSETYTSDRRREHEAYR